MFNLQKKNFMVDNYSTDERQCIEVSLSIVESEQLTTRETQGSMAAIEVVTSCRQDSLIFAEYNLFIHMSIFRSGPQPQKYFNNEILPIYSNCQMSLRAS